jgi:hypothetical protein
MDWPLLTDYSTSGTGRAGAAAQLKIIPDRPRRYATGGRLRIAIPRIIMDWPLLTDYFASGIGRAGAAAQLKTITGSAKG